MPATRLSWSLILHHCATPTDCHAHEVQEFNGVASGSFSAPDHEHPAWIELRLTATDSGGLADAASVQLDPRTVDLTFRSNPTGLRLTVGSSPATTEFSRTVIVGSRNTIAAPLTQTLNGTSYEYVSWSDGGPAQHDVIAPATPTTYTATYRAALAGCTSWSATYFANQTLSGTAAGERCESAIDYNWGGGGPTGVGVGTDNFSVRWVRTQEFSAGTYTFTATADDGVRVYLDGTLIIDQWRDQSATTSASPARSPPVPTRSRSSTTRPAATLSHGWRSRHSRTGVVTVDHGYRSPHRPRRSAYERDARRCTS